MSQVARRLFEIHEDVPIIVTPAPTLARADVRSALSEAVERGGKGIIYLQDKLGGEISIPATRRSPELAFDVTLVEIGVQGSRFSVESFGILEVQTMDFHGSYRNAVRNLEDALRLHGDQFPLVLRGNQQWLSDKIEGPNIANVFKRTLYQMVMKFRIGAHPPCAGCVLAIPLSVWDSWQKHLGQPLLHSAEDGVHRLVGGPEPTDAAPAWIYVFDIEASSARSPNPIRILRVIRTTAEAIAHYALKVAPDAAIEEGGSAEGITKTIQRRLAVWMPDLSVN